MTTCARPTMPTGFPAWTRAAAKLSLAVAVLVCWPLVTSCSRPQAADGAATTVSAPASPTSPPPSRMPPGTGLPASPGAAIASASETSVLPEFQPFCQALAGASGLFSAPAGGDDAAVLKQMKDTFTNLANLAPTAIKPEVQAMSNTIQSLQSVSDLTKLEDPNFVANQDRFAEFVKNSCGFDLSA